MSKDIAKILAVLVPIVGCSAVVVEDYPGPRGRYVGGDLDYATRNGAIVTSISGNPFFDEKSTFDAHVLALMKGKNLGVPAEFVAGPSEKTDPAFKVVVVFNPVVGVDSNAMCKDANSVKLEPNSNAVAMAIAFCHGDGAVSGTIGRVSGLNSAADPKFADLVSAVTGAMIPDSDGMEDDDGGDDPVPD